MGADGIVAPRVVGAFERGGTFRLNDYYSFRVPTRGFWTSDIDQHTREIWVFGPTSWVRVEPYTGRERERWVNEEDAHPSQTHATLDGIVESIRYAPVIPPLLAATGGTWGEVVLQWANSTDATGWQYRQRKYDNSQWEEWSAWVDVPNCGPADCSPTLTGLVPGKRYHFEVRPRSPGGGGDPLGAVRYAHRIDSTGFPWAGGFVAAGNTFSVGDDLILDVPAGLQLVVADRYYDSAGFAYDYSFTVLLDVPSGSWLVLDRVSGAYTDRHVTPDGHRRGVEALFDRIVESTRRVQPP